MSSDGKHVELSEAQIETAKGNVVSNKPVKVEFPNGDLRANRMELVNNGELVHFSGAVVLNTSGTAPAGQARDSKVNGASPPRPPIRVRSGSLEMRDKDHLATFAGNVIAMQGDSTLTCDTLVVDYAGGITGSDPAEGGATGSGQISRTTRLSRPTLLLLPHSRLAPAEKVIDIGDDWFHSYATTPRFAAMARAELRKRGSRNVQVINADALENGLEKSSYEIVHERLVLINLPPACQEALLAEMLSLLKPGGTVVLQEFDSASYVCYPEHPSWNTLLGIWNEVFHANGGEEFVGRSLGRLLRSARVEGVQMKVHVEVAQIGEYRRTHLLSLLESMNDLVLASGRITETDLRKHIAALSEHLADPGTTLIDKPFRLGARGHDE